MALFTSAFSMVLADYIGIPHCNGQYDILSDGLMSWVPPFYMQIPSLVSTSFRSITEIQSSLTSRVQMLQEQRHQPNLRMIRCDIAGKSFRQCWCSYCVANLYEALWLTRSVQPVGLCKSNQSRRLDRRISRISNFSMHPVSFYLFKLAASLEIREGASSNRWK